MNSNSTYEIDCDNEFVYPNTTLWNPYFRFAISTMYSLIFIIVLTGNGFVCYVVISFRKMRTVTNYYILNVAVADILTALLCIPFMSVSHLNKYWPFGSSLCPIVMYFQALGIFVSAYTLATVGIDRYILTMWPLRPRNSKRTALFVIALVWLVSGAIVVPSGVFAKYYQPNNTEYKVCNRYVCQEVFFNVDLMYEAYYFKIIWALQFVLPSLVIFFTYTSVLIIVLYLKSPGVVEKASDKRLARFKRNTGIRMATVIIVYAVCWFPFSIFMLVSHRLTEKQRTYLYFPLHLLAMSHACYNPVLYCLMNPKFRGELIDVLKTSRFVKKYLSTRSSRRPQTVLYRKCKYLYDKEKFKWKECQL